MPEIRKPKSIHRQYKIKDKIKYWNNKKEIRRKGKQITNMIFVDVMHHGIMHQVREILNFTLKSVKCR